MERGRHGIAGEFGHMVLVPGGLRCECGNRGCWEQYASGNALGREARELAEAGSPNAAEMLALAGGDPRTLVGSVVTAAAQAGDPTATELLAEVGEWLGVGLANLAAALDPGTFVVGGGVSEAGEMLLGPARQAFSRHLTGRGFRPAARVRQAELGPLAGLVGMADLARRAAASGRDVTAAGARTLRVLTWNVRDLLGDPFAVHRVLRAAAADVVCLQEVTRLPGSRQRLVALSRRSGVYFVAGGRSSAGTALLVSARTRAEDADAQRLPVGGWRTRPRGAVRATVVPPGTRSVSVTCLHLGLDPDERAAHVALLLAAVPTGVGAVVAGDLNEKPGGASWRALAARAADRAPDTGPTFPAAAPRHRIDAVLVDPALEVTAYGFPRGGAGGRRGRRERPPSRPRRDRPAPSLRGRGTRLTSRGRAPARRRAARGTGRCP